MTRPTTRADLIAANESSYQRLCRALDELPETVRTDATTQWPIDDGSRNPRDVLAHLHAWHLLVQGWYEVGMAGGRPDIPAPGFTWRTTPALNAEIHDRYLSWDYPRARTAYETSRAHCLALIDGHDDAELFTRSRYRWTGGNALAAYLISATCSHDEWARKTLTKIARAALRGGD